MVDVLTHGPYSQYASFFDLRNEPGAPFVIQLCNLGKPYGDVLSDGEISVDMFDGLPRLRYLDSTWPLCPESWSLFLGPLDSGPIEEAFANGSVEPAVDSSTYAEREAQSHRHLKEAEHFGRVENALAAVNRDPRRLDAVSSNVSTIACTAGLVPAN